MRIAAWLGVATVVVATACGSSTGMGPVSGTTGTGTGGGGGGTSGGGTGGSMGSTVSVGNNFFSPSTLSVAVNTTVTWSWNAGDVSHTVTFDDGPTSAVQSAGTYTRTFSAASTYTYHCMIHGLAMSGTITVQ